MLRRRLILVSALVAIAGSIALLARAAERTLVFEGLDGSARWVDAVEPADLRAAVPALDAVGAIETVDAGSCDAGVMDSVLFTGSGGSAAVTSAVLAAALGWPSDDLILVSPGSQGLPGCWADVAPDTATRHLRVAEVSIGGGDGDGIAECAETVEIALTISSVTETLDSASVVVEVLGPEATLVGPSWAYLGDLAPRSSASVAGTFQVSIADTVAGYDWITLSVHVGDDGGVYRSHRHVPIGCGLEASGTSPQVMFPVAGPSTYKQEWLTTHNPSIHEGVDVFASRMVPILAMADGVVVDVNWEHDPYGRSSAADSPSGTTRGGSLGTSTSTTTPQAPTTVPDGGSCPGWSGGPGSGPVRSSAGWAIRRTPSRPPRIFTSSCTIPPATPWTPTPICGRRWQHHPPVRPRTTSATRS